MVNGYSWSPKQGIVQVEIDGVDGRRSVTYIKPKPGLNYPYYFRTNYQGPADFWDIFHEISSDWNEYLGLKVLEPTRRDYIVLIDAQKHLRRIILPTIAN